MPVYQALHSIGCEPKPCNIDYSRYRDDFSHAPGNTREVIRRSRDSSLDMLAREEERRRAKLEGEEEERRVMQRAAVLEEEEDTWETLRASTEEILRCPPRKQRRSVEETNTEKSR